MPSSDVVELVDRIYARDCDAFAKMYAYCAVLNVVVHELDLRQHVTFEGSLPIRKVLRGMMKDKFNLGAIDRTQDIGKLLQALKGRAFQIRTLNLAAIKGTFWTVLGRGYLDDIAYVVKQIATLADTMQKPAGGDNEDIFTGLGFDNPHKRKVVVDYINSVSHLLDSAVDLVNTVANMTLGSAAGLVGFVSLLALSFTVGHVFLSLGLMAGGFGMAAMSFFEVDDKAEAVDIAEGKFEKAKQDIETRQGRDVTTNAYRFFDAIKTPLAGAVATAVPEPPVLV